MDGDLIFGTVLTALFLVVVFGAGLLLYRFKNRRFSKAWQPLIPIIGGSIRGDGGGAATSWLSGAYKGRRVHASMSPHINEPGRDSSATTGFAYNAFEIVICNVPGKQDWSVTCPTTLLGRSPGSWQITASDATLREQLQERSLINVVAALGYPSHSVAGTGLPVLAYRARDGELHYREDAGPQWLPSAERFREELETLLRVAEINAEVNAASRSIKTT